MNCRRLTSLASSLLVAAALGACERPTDQRVTAPADTDPVVFEDALNADFQAFLGSKLDALSIDTTERFEGTASMKISVPTADGGFAGGAFPTAIGRDLSGYDALTFWAKASIDASVNVVGLGNDNTGNSLYEASTEGIDVTTTWQRYVIPIPRPDRLTRERGLFFFAEGEENGQAYDLWFDEVRFSQEGTISNARPVIPGGIRNLFVGAEVEVEGARVAFDVAGTDIIMSAQQFYFDFISSDESVVSTANNRITVVGPGSATVTAELDGVAAIGSITINSAAPPATAAPMPTYSSADVISLFSNAYSNVLVDNWSADWDRADVADLQIEGNDTKAYTSLSFAGILFETSTVDASSMTHFSVDVFAPTGSTFKVKLVDFGPDNAFSGGDDSEFELSFNATTTPAFSSGQWVTLDIPLTAFTGLTETAHLAQLIFAGNASTVFLDNILFHR